MPLHRRILLLSIVLVGGSLGATGYYGLHLRSEAYRAEVEADLSAYFELPCDLGRIRGHTFDSRAFEDVAIWLADRRDRVFFCKTAIWCEKKADGQPANELELADGQLILGSDRWVKEDYRKVLESGLGHDFSDLDLRRVGMSGFQILFVRSGVSIRCGNTSGTIDMSDPQDGVARLVAYELNGHRITQGMQIDARFLPRNGLEVSEFVLTLPEVPLAVIGVGPALGGEITSGRFAGQVQYLAAEGAPEIWLSGQLRDVELAELTGRLPCGPLAGHLTVTVDEARLADVTVTHFRGHGQICDLELAPLAALLGAEGVSGTATLNIDPVDLAMGRVNRLRLDGRVSGLTLEELLRKWGRGSATGDLTIRVNNLDVVDDHIRSADVEIFVVPPGGETGTMDRDLLLSVAEKALDFSWPESVPKRILPEKVEYASFGMRLLVRDNLLRILGTHGDGGRTILTIKVFGQPIELVKEQPGTIDLGPYLARTLEGARTYDTDHVREWWRSRKGE